MTKGAIEDDPTYLAFVRNGIDVQVKPNSGDLILPYTLTHVDGPTFTMIWANWNEDMLRTAIENYPLPVVIDHDEKEA